MSNKYQRKRRTRSRRKTRRGGKSKKAWKTKSARHGRTPAQMKAAATRRRACRPRPRPTVAGALLAREQEGVRHLFELQPVGGTKWAVGKKIHITFHLAPLHHRFFEGSIGQCNHAGICVAVNHLGPRPRQVWRVPPVVGLDEALSLLEHRSTEAERALRDR